MTGFDDLRAAAVGHWREILTGLGIDARALTNKHGPCPGCGGTDRFRFDDQEGRGTFVCGRGGDPLAGDGFDLLGHVYGWDNGEAMRQVAAYLGLDDRQPMSEAERAKLKRHAAARQAKEEAERKARQEDAARRARAILEAAQGDPAAHPYAVKKAVPLGPLVKRGAWPQRGWDDALLVPIYGPDGKPWTLEAISPDGDKDYLAGGRKRGGFHPLGKIRGADRVLIGEGLATVAAAHAVMGWPAVAAMDAGNLLDVARTVQALAPDAALILLADNDTKEDGSNPGLVAAHKAAHEVGGRVAVPELGGRSCDFWDLWHERGPDAAREAIEHPVAPDLSAFNQTSLKNGVSGVTGVTPANHAGHTVTPDQKPGVTGVTEREPDSIPAEARPCFRVFDEPVRIREAAGCLRPGVWYFGLKHGKGDETPPLTQQWICSPLHLEAVTHDDQGNNFGRLLRFRNTLGQWRQWAMPMELLRGAGDELRGELLAMGVHIDPAAHRLLGQYLQASVPKNRVLCALQVGWCGDSYVLPDEVIGPNAEAVIFQSGERSHDEHTRAGTLEGWCAEIAARAVGNPLLVLALSAAFAGPVLARCNAESGGIHYVGDSSTGKTTAIEAACSVWGGPNYRRSWRATANGMEGAAALFNDGLLALDEISECDPREVGAIVYALGNGRGKQRASRSGQARSVARWRCMVLSSGERTIATTMAEGGHRVKAGQAVRLLDVPAARRYGAWDDLHGLPSGTAFSDAIKRAAATHYGHAGRAFLRHLTHDNRDLCVMLERIKALPWFQAASGEGQERRAAARFALLALAGELATEYGITGWPEGVAIESAKVAYEAWRSMRGGGNDERRQILEQLAGFIERHGDSRFSSVEGDRDFPVHNRAGWWTDLGDQGRQYLFTSDGIREALKGFDFTRALDVLQEAGVIDPPGADGKRSKAPKIGGRTVRVYAVYWDRLEASHGLRVAA